MVRAIRNRGRFYTCDSNVRAEKCLRREVETYDKFLTGQVYGYSVTGPDCEDSCWGFFDLESMVQEVKSNIANAGEKDVEI